MEHKELEKLRELKEDEKQQEPNQEQEWLLEQKELVSKVLDEDFGCLKVNNAGPGTKDNR
ncbi:GM17608 [Drosophila sechellia]|uniref:GM17608 n=1 Tax=Drosophila sechellia TaxID=7238 RepID=B4IG28_DROSE|nr:GM17608 [Drosophila sechellia]